MTGCGAHLALNVKAVTCSTYSIVCSTAIGNSWFWQLICIISLDSAQVPQHMTNATHQPATKADLPLCLDIMTSASMLHIWHLPPFQESEGHAPVALLWGLSDSSESLVALLRGGSLSGPAGGLAGEDHLTRFLGTTLLVRPNPFLPSGGEPRRFSGLTVSASHVFLMRCSRVAPCT